MDTCEAASRLFEIHLSLIARIVGRSEFDSFFVEPITGVWQFRHGQSRLVFATPFFEHGDGIACNVTDLEGNEIVEGSWIPYEITGDAAFDARAYVAAVTKFLHDELPEVSA